MRNDMVTVGAVVMVGLAAYLLLKSRNVKAVSSSSSNVAAVTAKTSEILTGALPGDLAWGWTYYTDGTAISPTGDYYYKGAKVWSPN